MESLHGLIGSGLVLTDDEYLAVAAGQERQVPSLVPSIAVDDPTALRDSVTRGRRSLVARGLLSLDDGKLVAPLGALGSVLGSSSIAVYLGSESFDRVSWAGSVMLSMSPQAVVVDRLHETGLHAYGVLTSEEARNLLAGMIDAARADAPGPESGVSEPPRPSWLCFLADGPDGSLLVRVRGGEIQCSEAELTDTGVRAGPGRPVSAGDGAEALLATCA